MKNKNKSMNMREKKRVFGLNILKRPAESMSKPYLIVENLRLKPKENDLV